MTVVRVKGFKIFKDRHGRERCYHRKTGERIDLTKAPMGEFLAECARISALALMKCKRPRKVISSAVAPYHGGGSKSDGGSARGGPFVCPHPSVSNANGLRIIAIWAKHKWRRRGTLMATPGQLVKCIAEALSIPEASVVQYDRLLAENGLRSKGGRGTSAAKVTAVDAANLLIAIMGSPVIGASIKPAIEVCRTYGRLPLKVGGTSENLETFSTLGLPTVSKLPTSHTLRDGIAALIEAASVGERLIIDFEDGEQPVSGPETDRHVSIRIDGPTPWADITADASLGDGTPEGTTRYQAGRFVYHNIRRTPAGIFKRREEDFHQTRWITFKSIRRIGALLAQTNAKAA